MVPSCSEDIQLRKADNPWTSVTVAKKKGANVRPDEVDDLLKKVRTYIGDNGTR
jgi:hypothetical protein